MVRLLALTAALALAACAPTANGAGDASASASPSLTGQVLFVANKRGNSLSKIDLVTGEEVQRVDSCANPHELATSPDGKWVALACYGGTTVDIFSTADLSHLRSIELGGNARPHGIVWHSRANLYVTAEGRKSLFHIQSPTGEMALFEHPTGKLGSHMLAVAPDRSAAWTMDLGSGTVTRVDLFGGQPPLSVKVGVEPEGISLTPDGSELWVSARGSNKAIALEPMTLEIRSEVTVGAFPLRLSIRPQGDVAVTSDLADGTLTVIDLASAKAVRTIAVSSSQEAQTRLQVTILWSSDGNRIYVAETGTDTVAEVDYASGTVLRRLRSGEGGDGLAILP